MRVPGAIVRAWWRVRLPLEVGFLGFGRDRYAVEHVCGVGFVRRGLDLCRSDRERHGLLGLEDLDTAGGHGGCEMLWSLDPADKHV